MKKRVFAVLMAMIISVSSVQLNVLAENDGEKEVKGDAIVTVSVDNSDCVQLSELEAAEITAVIGLKNKPEFESLRIKVEAIDMDMTSEETELSFWLGYQEEAIEKAFLDYLSDKQGDLFADLEEGLGEEDDMSELEEDAEEMLDDASDLLNEIDITFEGLPEHYELDMEMSSCTIVTSELVKAIIEMVEELITLIYEDINMEELGVKGLLNEILKQEGSSLDELIAELATEDAEIAEQIKSLLNEIDEVLEYMQSEEFPGVLFVGATLSCDCPIKEFYEIIHEYYKNVDGKNEYIGSEYEDLEDYAGEIIKAEDFIKCEYGGVTYEYKGSFNANVVFEEAYYEYDWSGYELNEFELGDEEYWGMLLRYEVVEETTEKDTVEDESDKPDDEDKTVEMEETEETEETGEIEEAVEKVTQKEDDKKEEKNELEETTVHVSDKKAAPETGDIQDGRFFFAAALAALGMIILTVRRREY